MAGRTAWACPYTDFPLLEIRPDHEVRVRENPVRGADGLAVRGDRVLFFGGYGERHDRVAGCRLTEETVEVVAERRVLRPDGGELGRRRVVCRGPRVYVQGDRATEWAVLDIT